MWQLLTLLTLLVMMIALERFQPESADVYLGSIPFSAKSLAATGFIVLAAFTTGELFKKFKIPALLGYIAAGVVFGPELIQVVYEAMREHMSQVADWVFGPQAPGDSGAPRALFSRVVINDLNLINILTVGVIGTMGGGELKIADIKDTWRTILLIIVFIVLTALPLSVGAVMALVYLPGNLASFLGEVSTSSKIAAALLLGILAVAMSPAATLAIIQESKARGKFTSLVLGIVVVADLTLVAMFLVGFNVAKLMVGPAGFEMEALLAAMPAIALEFGWALVIGAVTGVVIILYMRYVKREMMLFTIAVIFAATTLATKLHAETLLAFLTAGFIVQNFSRHGHDLIHELERISMPVFIIYFMTQAALLDLKGVVAFLPLTLILAAVRALAFWVSVKGGLRLIPAEERTERWLWISFFSRGGVDLVLAGMVASATVNGEPVFSWGTDFQTVVMATVVVHIVAGPPLLKMAFSGARETEEARLEALEAVAGGEAMGSTVIPEEPLEFPHSLVRNPLLASRLDELREGLIEVHTRFVAEPLESQRHVLERSITLVNEELHQALEKLREVVEATTFETTEAQIEAIESLHLHSRRRIRPYILEWEGLDPRVFGKESAHRLLLQIEQMEEFTNQYVVEMEPALYERAGGQTPWHRFLRTMRRVERFLAGTPGRRVVPTGRLWRYYVQLGVPMYLAEASRRTAVEHESLWFELGVYLGRFDAIFEHTALLLRTPQQAPPKPEASPAEQALEQEAAAAPELEDELYRADSAMSQTFAMKQVMPQAVLAGAEPEEGHPPQAPEEAPKGAVAHGPFSLEPMVEQLDPHGAPAARALEFVRLATATHQENAQGVIMQANRWLQVATQQYSWSLQQAYRAMLDAVEIAGTLELPAFRYRTSSQYDNARRAKERLTLRLEREANVVSGYAGWIVLDHQLFLFGHWFVQYEQRVLDTLRNLFEQQCLQYLERLERKCEQGVELFEAREDTEKETEWEAWHRREITPMVRSTRRALDRALVSFGQGVASRRLIDALEYRVASFPESARLLLEDPHRVNPREGDPETIVVRVRQWMSNRLVGELALRFIEFNERVERMARRALVALDNIEQVLEYNLFTAQQTPARTLEDTLGPERESSEGQDDSDHVALGALRRAGRFVEQMREALRGDLTEVEEWILHETHELRLRAIDPFVEHKLPEVQRKLRRHELDVDEAGPGKFSRVTTPVRSLVRRGYTAIFPFASELWEDLRHILNDEVRAARRARVRQQLEIDLKHSLEVLPPIYKRLFNPVPLDLPEFYVSRPQLEARVLEAVAQWGGGERVSILLFGDRGIGKRTFIHNLMPIKVYDLAPVFQEIAIHTVRLSEEVETEAQLCAQFSLMFPGATLHTLDELERALGQSEERCILLLENANKIYARTEQGMAMCKRFLKLVGATSQHILWFVTLDTPAATLLDTMIDLFDYFTSIFEVEPLSHEAIEHMILNRHRVSGFEVEYEPPHHRPIERLRHPLASREAQRHPKRDFFRRLGDMSHGNPLLALLYWLRAITPDPQDETRLAASLPYPSPADLTLSMGLQKHLILALLIQHGSLTLSQLALMLGTEGPEVQTELNQLARLRFVKTVAGASQCYQLQDFAVVEVTRELRQHNLL